MSEDITSADKTVASESVCIDFTVPEAFRGQLQIYRGEFQGCGGRYDGMV